ncbi:MAG: energy transducer TonB [Bacteroidota bacterium]
MIKLLQIFFYGFERSTEGDLEDPLFANRNQAYGAYQLRRAQPWYMLSSMALVFGLLGTAWLSWVWWGPKPSPRQVQMIQNQYFCCEWVSQDPYLEIWPKAAKTKPELAPLSYDQHRRAGNGTEQLDPGFQPPKPVKAPPKYGLGIGGGYGKGLDGWILPDLPGDEEEVPDVILRVKDSPKGRGFICLFPSEPQPINYEEIMQLIQIPPHTRDIGISGTVVLQVLVDEKGRYIRHKILVSPHLILTKAVEAQIDKIRFKVFHDTGKYWVNIPFHFKRIP